MKDLIITIDHETRKVKFNRDFIGLTGENLQGNIVVDFSDKTDFVDGSAGFEVEQNGEKYRIGMTKNEDEKTYSVPIKSSLLQNACEMKCQVVIIQEATDAGTPVFKSEVFSLPCKEAINATETIPEQYPSWVEDTTARLDAVEQKVENVSSFSYITVTGLEDYAQGKKYIVPHEAKTIILTDIIYTKDEYGYTFAYTQSVNRYIMTDGVKQDIDDSYDGEYFQILWDVGNVFTVPNKPSNWDNISFICKVL